MTWSPKLEQGVESLKIRWDIVSYTRGKVLDLGSSTVSPFAHWTSVDTIKPQTANGRRFPDVQADCSQPMPVFGTGSWDSVVSSHLLEHVVDYKAALREWWRIVRVGGYLVLYLPHKELYPNIGTADANADHKHDFMPDDILSAMKEIGGFELIENQVRSQDDEYSFLQVYRKRDDSIMMDFTQNRPTKTAAVFRCGGFGDMIQASSVIRAMHDEGYSVTLYTSPRGYAIIKHDPYIARIMLQDEDQVPNHMLGEYWKRIAGGYTKFVNLSGSVETALLPLPTDVGHGWPHKVRHQMMNRNYLEFQHALAEVDAPIRAFFYETKEEALWATQERAKIKGRVVLWSLSGSSVHKVWSAYVEAITRIVDADTAVVLMGDQHCSGMAAAIDHPNVVSKCGVWSIRESMAMCRVADLIVGPETGVLNAAGQMPTPKICLLSHSSEENLTKHWVNTVSLAPEKTPCHPCHRLHFGFEHCHEVKPAQDVIQWAKKQGIEAAGSALCMENISVDRVVEAANKYLQMKVAA